MASTNDKSFYVSKDSSSENKEQKLLDYIFSLPKDKLDSIRGNPQKVLDTIDEYASRVDRFMNVGKYKGTLVVEKIRDVKPILMIELGCYVGYSAILFAKELLQEPASKYYSFEASPEFAEIARKIIDLAGLSDKIEVIVGNAAKSLVEFEDRLNRERSSYFSIDFIFIDHAKELYVPDIRVLESLNLIAPGTIIVADNIIKPGAPEYAKYVKSSPEEKREFNYQVENVNGKNFLGRWNILYDSETVESLGPGGEKDAIEITKCVQYLNG